MGEWGAHTNVGIMVQEFPGDHFFLHTARRQLLRMIAGILFRAES
jgi:surfactin synthase thioesterase subunit